MKGALFTAIKDVLSIRIVGYSSDDAMRACIPVAVVNNDIAPRRRGRLHPSFRPRKSGPFCVS